MLSFEQTRNIAYLVGRKLAALPRVLVFWRATPSDQYENILSIDLKTDSKQEAIASDIFTPISNILSDSGICPSLYTGERKGKSDKIPYYVLCVDPCSIVCEADGTLTFKSITGLTVELPTTATAADVTWSSLSVEKQTAISAPTEEWVYSSDGERVSRHIL